MTAEEDREFQERTQRIEALLDEAKRFPDPKARLQVQEIVQGLLDLHGAALERVLEGIAGLGEPGAALIDSLARDDLVGNLFILYGLHPLDVETRVRAALDEVRPFAQSHGCSVELLRVAGGAVRLRVHGGTSSPAALKEAIEAAIFNRAPDLNDIDIEGLPAHELYESNGHARFALPLV